MFCDFIRKMDLNYSINKLSDCIFHIDFFSVIMMLWKEGKKQNKRILMYNMMYFRYKNKVFMVRIM